MNVNTGPTLKVPSQTPKSILTARRGYTGTASAATVEIEVCIMYCTCDDVQGRNVPLGMNTFVGNNEYYGNYMTIP